MKVWVVEVGADYESSFIADVFDHKPSEAEINEIADSEHARFAGYINAFPMQVKDATGITSPVTEEPFTYRSSWTEEVGTVWTRAVNQ